MKICQPSYWHIFSVVSIVRFKQKSCIHCNIYLKIRSSGWNETRFEWWTMRMMMSSHLLIFFIRIEFILNSISSQTNNKLDIFKIFKWIARMHAYTEHRRMFLNFQEVLLASAMYKLSHSACGCCFFFLLENQKQTYNSINSERAISNVCTKFLCVNHLHWADFKFLVWVCFRFFGSCN